MVQHTRIHLQNWHNLIILMNVHLKRNRQTIRAPLKKKEYKQSVSLKKKEHKRIKIQFITSVKKNAYEHKSAIILFFCY